jgi:hypothetical protein
LHDYLGTCDNIGLKAYPDVNLSLTITTNVLALSTYLSFDNELCPRQLNWEIRKSNVEMSFVKYNLTRALTLAVTFLC